MRTAIVVFTAIALGIVVSLPTLQQEAQVRERIPIGQSVLRPATDFTGVVERIDADTVYVRYGSSTVAFLLDPDTRIVRSAKRTLAERMRREPSTELVPRAALPGTVVFVSYEVRNESLFAQDIMVVKW